MIQKKIWGIFLSVVLLFFVTDPLYGQATISSMVPNNGVHLKAQLWNVSITSAYNGTVEAQVRMDMRDLLTRETVPSAVTSRFNVDKGAKMLQVQSVQPIQYSSSSGSVDLSSNGLLPAGQYQVCYQLFIIVHNDLQPVADDCIQLQVEPLSPPLLTLPEDSAMLETATPVFTWVPPAPLAMFANLAYDFQLCEVLPGQSATDAIQSNLPVQQARALQQPFLQYPMQSRTLERGKLYAWQIVARDRSRFAAKSEVWVFSVKNDSTKNTTGPDPYFLIGQANTVQAEIHDGLLKMEYHHSSKDSMVTVSIVATTEPTRVLASFRSAVRYGQNFLVFDLSTKMRLADGSSYEARITDASKKVQALQFRNKSNK